jgi:hypothetical protein
LSGVDDVVALRVFVGGAGHRADQAEIVGARTDVGKEFADRHAALAVVAKTPRAGHDAFHIVKHGGLHGHRHRLSCVATEARLGIEAVDVRDAAGHKTKYDAFDFGREVGLLSREARECREAEAGGSLPEYLTAREESLIEHTGNL